VRFWDNEVLSNLEEVLMAIVASINDPTLTPTPLPMGEGLKSADL
jgi:hypothetical protein